MAIKITIPKSDVTYAVQKALERNGKDTPLTTLIDVAWQILSWEYPIVDTDPIFVEVQTQRQDLERKEIKLQ